MMIIRIAPKQIVGTDLSNLRRNMKHLVAVNISQNLIDCICYVGRNSLYCVKLNLEECSVSYFLYYNKPVEKYAINPNSLLRNYCATLLCKNVQKENNYK